jgi:hypothetical protein
MSAVQIMSFGGREVLDVVDIPGAHARRRPAALRRLYRRDQLRDTHHRVFRN